MKYPLFNNMLLRSFIILSCIIITTLSSSSQHDDNDNNNNIMYCTQGFGTSSYSSSDNMVKIEPHQINDGYCDCPYENGIDEYQTDACSGSTHWAGITSSNNHNNNDNGNMVVKRTTCPQQPNIILSPSKINDSICDCCDGYDEQLLLQSSSQGNTSSCPNNCDELLAAQREQYEQLKSKYVNGLQKRQENIISYKTMIQDQKVLVGTLNDRKDIVVKKRNELNEKLNEWKVNFWMKYHSYVKDVYQSMISNGSNSALSTLVDMDNVNELKDVIYSICHLYGELTSTSNNDDGSTSCLPLRLAGLDLGFQWSQHNQQDDNDNVTVLQVIDNIDTTDKYDLMLGIANLLLHNHNENGQKKTNDELIVDFGNQHNNIANTSSLSSKHQVESKKKKDRKHRHRRRRMDDDDDYYNEDGIEDKDDEDYYDDDHHHKHMDDDDDYDDDYDDDEYMKEHEEKTRPVDRQKNRHRKETIAQNKGHESNDNESIGTQESIFYSSFGKLLRLPFYQQTDLILTDIKNILAEIEEKDKSESETDDEESDDEEHKEGQESSGPNVDPMGLTMIKNTLNQKRMTIGKGNSMAKSANELLDVLDTYFANNELGLISHLKQIIVGTIYHSNLHFEDIFEVLELVNSKFATIDEETCFDWYYALCNSDVNAKLLDRCEERRNENNMNVVCGNTNEEMKNNPTIPNHIPDGYYNFYPPKLREEKDMFSTLFQSMNALNDIFHKSPDTVKNEENISILENELKDINGKLKSSTDIIAEEENYGPDGILYAIRDQCFDILANKYRYEVCIFGKSTQREGDSQSGSGTDLGKWQEYSMDEETGSLVLKWTGGQKCWNGPKRSATVIVTCGEENTLLSADEPNICEYEFKMESFIACNDAFKNHHNLSLDA